MTRKGVKAKMRSTTALILEAKGISEMINGLCRTKGHIPAKKAVGDGKPVPIYTVT